MASLKQVRKEWEKGSKTVLAVPIYMPNGLLAKFYVIVSYQKDKTVEYRLHRYFTIGGNWEVSVDVDSTVNLQQALDNINKDKDVVQMIAYLES